METENITQENYQEDHQEATHTPSIEELMEENQRLSKRASEMQENFRRMQSNYDKQVYRAKSGINENVIPKPNANDYQTHEEYINDLVKWQIVHGEQNPSQVFNKMMEERELRDESNKRYSEFLKHVNNIKKELPDFEEITKNDFIQKNFWGRCNNGLPEAIQEMGEDGARIAYYLCNNFDIATELVDVPHYKLAAKLTKLSKEIRKPKIERKEQKNTINPVSGKNYSAKDGEVDELKMSGDEWYRWKKNKEKNR